MFKNLTRNAVRLRIGDEIITIPKASKTEAIYVKACSEEVVKTPEGVPLVRLSQELSYDPPKEEGVLYIVPYPVRMLAQREDFVSPDCGRTANKAGGQIDYITRFLV